MFAASLKLFATLAFPFLLIGCVISPFVWMHHDLHADSPMFARERDMDAWIRENSERHQGVCLAGSEVTRRIDDGPYVGKFAQFRCRTTRTYWRLAACFVLPLLVAALISYLLRPRARSL